MPFKWSRSHSSRSPSPRLCSPTPQPTSPATSLQFLSSVATLSRTTPCRDFSGGLTGRPWRDRTGTRSPRMGLVSWLLTVSGGGCWLLRVSGFGWTELHCLQPLIRWGVGLHHSQWEGLAGPHRWIWSSRAWLGHNRSACYDTLLVIVLYPQI